MRRFSLHPTLFLLLCGAAVTGTHCGGADDEAGGKGGAMAGAGSGSGGKGGSNGKAGSSGKAGSNGDGGDGADSSSGGAGAAAGAGDSPGNGGQAGGGAGEGGAPDETIALTVADSESELIDADDGGTVTLGDLTLVIPPGALAEDTEITIRNFEETSAFVLEPDGLEFETPITARFTLPADELEGADVEGAPVFVLETASLGEPMELVPTTSVRLDEEDNYIAEAELSHFSGILPRFVSLDIQSREFISLEDLTVKPVVVPVGVMFGVVGMLGLSEDAPYSPVHAVKRVGRRQSNIAAVVVTLTGTSATGTDGRGFATVAGEPNGQLSFDTPRPVEPDVPVMFSRQYRCTEAGTGVAAAAVTFTLEFDATASGYAVFQDTEGRFSLVPGLAGSRHIEVKSSARIIPDTDVTCLDAPSTLTALGVTPGLDPLVAGFKAAWQQHCFWLSNHAACQAPAPARAVINVLDPVLEVGPVAAARLEAAFPCGDGPVGRTLCETPGTFAEGDYVFVLATFGDDIPLDDDTSLFQHAFVFDADGDSSNNYVPSPQYPDDFFAGTDKWYQLFYTPSGGFSMRVVDARVSTSDPVSTNARMVIAGRELSAFIPRAELGADPGFRVSTFRHEGDYGLDGGPWDASYYPPLGEPLMPSAAGDPIVLSEEQ
ncbi:MAG TPA: hypothetical protein VGK73_05570 [Polyangiaceae bacterium]